MYLPGGFTAKLRVSAQVISIERSCYLDVFYTIILEKPTDAYSQRDHIYYSLGDSQEAIEDYSQILSLKANISLAYFYRGLIQNTLRHIQKAIGNYNRTLKTNPDLAEAYFQRRIFLYYLGGLHRVVESYSQAFRTAACKNLRVEQFFEAL